jgi:hypothetical protein
LKAIGNLLGRFLKVDEQCLNSQDKRMDRVLVEIDIHAGLMEVLELEWRGQVMIQRLEYLGIPFRCSHCRQTGHLRNDCSKGTSYGKSEDFLDDSLATAYMSEEEEVGLTTAPGDVGESLLTIPWEHLLVR